ncbi:CD209 antigen-like protein E [Engraulis encrasicolus]|uniref:CD209 antigen-like protein E n=1 Tax=Engraulis encrasicolus TaxID=184585 RepID=UPI002FD73F57
MDTDCVRPTLDQREATSATMPPKPEEGYVKCEVPKNDPPPDFSRSNDMEGYVLVSLRCAALLRGLCILLFVTTITMSVLYNQKPGRSLNETILEAQLLDIQEQLATQINMNEDIQAQLDAQTTVNANLTLQIEDLQSKMSSCSGIRRTYEGRCYYFSTDKMNWTDSRDACESMGGHLLILNDTEEMDFATNHGAGFWIGLSDLDEEGTFRWVDGTLLTNSNLTWSPGQPNNWQNQDCVVFSESNSFLSDDSCDSLRFRICESNCDV